MRNVESIMEVLNGLVVNLDMVLLQFYQVENLTRKIFSATILELNPRTLNSVLSRKVNTFNSILKMETRGTKKAISTRETACLPSC